MNFHRQTGRYNARSRRTLQKFRHAEPVTIRIALEADAFSIALESYGIAVMRCYKGGRKGPAPQPPPQSLADNRVIKTDIVTMCFSGAKRLWASGGRMQP